MTIKNNMKYTLVISLFMFSILSKACSCPEKQLQDYFDSCKHLFTATLYEAKLSAEDDSSIIGEFRNSKDVMAGDPSKIKGLRTTMLGTSCEVDVSVGKRYLVCGNEEEYIPVMGCSYTQPIWWKLMQEKVDRLTSYKKTLAGKRD